MHFDAVPVYKLYGETGHWPTPDLLHCESIAARSRLHHWHIRRHRHSDLVHLLHIQSGGVSWEFDGRTREASGPIVIVVPEMVIHGFRFSADIEGHIVTLARPLVVGLRERFESGEDILARAAGYRLAGESADEVAHLIKRLTREYRQQQTGRDLMLQALISALVVQLTRRARQHRLRQRCHQDRGERHLARFQVLIEAHFAEQPTIESLATRLGISAAHLNTLCQRLAGRSALQLLHERLLLEARRALIYTHLSIGQIADSLGFSEPAYFARFFKRHTRLSPRAFRQQQRQP